MPRQPRLDAPGALHHVIVRGIEQREIVRDNKDRDEFVSRMGKVSTGTDTDIFAWALMDNHAHILLRSGTIGLSTFMRRFLSGYASYFNRTHKRHGHLFQNRYKSIICEEQPYFLELVRYIHLNPLRAGRVESYSKLAHYAYSGHSTILNPGKHPWMKRKYVLEYFDKSEEKALQAYNDFVNRGIEEGHRPDLVGGGLIRSQGGWENVKEMRRQGKREKSDERILGRSEFVESLLIESNQFRKNQLSTLVNPVKIDELIKKVCREESISLEALISGNRRRQISTVRSRLAKILVEEMGLTLTATGQYLGVSPSAIAKSIRDT